MKFRFLLFSLVLLSACKPDSVSMLEVFDSFQQETSLPDTLEVITLEGPSSYFRFNEQEMGYDYELIQDFSEFVQLPIKITIADNEREMLRKLRNGKAHLAAYSLYETRALKEDFSFVAHQEHSYMVLVQNIGLNTVTELDELAGKTVHVVEHSIYHERLLNLDTEIGGGINIITLPDSLNAVQLIDMVVEKKIEYTLAHYRDVMQIRDYNRRLDGRVAVGFQQRNGWLVRKGSTALQEKIKEWENRPDAELLRSQLYGKYRIRNPYYSSRKLRIPKGAVSPYDAYFKKYAPEIGWDWRLLAAIAFHESRFDSSVVSRMGASGLMQLMPRTAASFGLNRADILNPEKNIEAGVQYIKSLNLMYRRVQDPKERVKFILASYNSGPAHIIDAMALAEKYGKNKYIWFEHVEPFLAKKNDPKYYQDEVVKYGYFRPNHTIQYVRNTLDTFRKYGGEL